MPETFSPYMLKQSEKRRLVKTFSFKNKIRILSTDKTRKTIYRILRECLAKEQVENAVILTVL